MYESMRFLLALVVRDFLSDGAYRSERLFRDEDINFEPEFDRITLPCGKIVRVTFEFVPEDIGG